MGRNTFDAVVRRANRCADIASRASNPAITIAFEPVKQAHDRFTSADKQVADLASSERKERSESADAIAPLAKVYDEVRSATLTRIPTAELRGRSSSFATPDDLLAGADVLEDLLMHAGGVDADHPVNGTGNTAPTGQSWAVDLLKALDPKYTVALKENKEAVAASASLQKAKTERHDARAVLISRIQGFRWVVRDVYGPQSREFHSIRDRTAADADVEPSTPAIPPAPPATPVK